MEALLLAAGPVIKIAQRVLGTVFGGLQDVARDVMTVEQFTAGMADLAEKLKPVDASLDQLDTKMTSKEGRIEGGFAALRAARPE